MDKVLTPLEAAILGMWLMGMRWVCRCEGGQGHYAIACDKNPPKCEWNNGWDYSANDAWFWDLEDDPSEKYILSELAGTEGIIGLHFWLTAHGITPPEVGE